MILAIDQGSSKTQALVGDAAGELLAAARGEGACHFHVGMEAAMRAVEEAADAALARAGLTREAVETVSAGLAGANWPEEFAALTENLEKRFPRARVAVYNDCVPALFAGTRSANAVALCAGTAFNACVRRAGEIVFVYNNYMEPLDEGGKGLALRALQEVFRSQTGMGGKTSLLERAMAFFGYDEPLPMLLDFTRNSLKRPLKDFAPVVDEEAMRGDRVALNVQYGFARSLSRYAVAALEQYGMLGAPADVVLSGGVFKARSPVMADAIRAHVHRAAPLARVVAARWEPVVGAYFLALDEAARERLLPRVASGAERLSLTRSGGGRA